MQLNKKKNKSEAKLQLESVTTYKGFVMSTERVNIATPFSYF